MKSLLILLLATVPLHAQEAPEHTCRILFLDGPDSAPDTLYLFDGAEAQEVELPRMNFSQVYKLRPGNLTLTMLTAPPEDPEELPAGAPTAQVPATTTDFYLLVTHNPANEVAPVRLQVIPAGQDKLKRGQMLWFNLTDNPIGGMVGSEKLALKAKSKMTLDAPARKRENYNVNLSFRIPGKEHIYPLCETQWLHDPRSRNLAFVLTKPGIRTPRVLVFPDYREKEEDE
jgi:hypothetical protein